MCKEAGEFGRKTNEILQINFPLFFSKKNVLVSLHSWIVENLHLKYFIGNAMGNWEREMKPN